MGENIPEALRGPLGEYISNYDDGTNRYADFVSIDGVPGLWPDGPHIAARATYVRGTLAMLHNAGQPLTNGAIALVVAYGDTMGRISHPDVAHLAAIYEDELRGRLPAARAELIAAHTALTAYQEQHSVPEEPSLEPGRAVMYREVQAARKVVEDRFALAVGPEIFAEGVALARAYRAAQQRLGSMCSDLMPRGVMAEKDFARGHDRTLELMAADAEKYGPL